MYYFIFAFFYLGKKGLTVDASQPSTEATSPSLKMSVLLWNINGLGEAETRNVLVPNVVEEVNPDVLLLQEIMSETRVKPLTKPQNAKYEQCFETSTKKESRILFNKEKWECVSEVQIENSQITLRDALKKSIDEVVPQTTTTRSGEPTGWRKTYRDRITIVGLTRQGHKTTVFLSFHNAYTGLEDSERKKSCEDFCKIVYEISQRSNCVVIAGADLNYEMPPGDCNGATVIDYDATKRRTKKIDHFIVVAPQSKFEVKALSFINTGSDDQLHDSMEKLRKQSNHDQYTNALERGLSDGLNKDLLKKDLKESLEKGLDTTLYSALEKSLNTTLHEVLNKELTADLHKSLGKELYETLQGGMREALHIFEKAAKKALDHDPLLLTIELPA